MSEHCWRLHMMHHIIILHRDHMVVSLSLICMVGFKKKEYLNFNSESKLISDYRPPAWIRSCFLGLLFLPQVKLVTKMKVKVTHTQCIPLIKKKLLTGDVHKIEKNYHIIPLNIMICPFNKSHHSYSVPYASLKL